MPWCISRCVCFILSQTDTGYVDCTMHEVSWSISWGLSGRNVQENMVSAAAKVNDLCAHHGVVLRALSGSAWKSVHKCRISFQLETCILAQGNLSTISFISTKSYGSLLAVQLVVIAGGTWCGSSCWPSLHGLCQQLALSGLHAVVRLFAFARRCMCTATAFL